MNLQEAHESEGVPVSEADRTEMLKRAEAKMFEALDRVVESSNQLQAVLPKAIEDIKIIKSFFTR